MPHDGALSGISGCTHRKYGLTCEEFEELLQRSQGLCEICERSGTSTKHGRLYIDHDPRLGLAAVRGLLCASCNSKLAVDNAFNEKAHAYLARPARSPRKRPRRKRVPRPNLTGVMAGLNERMTAMENAEQAAQEARANFGRALKYYRDSGLSQDAIARELDVTRERLRQMQRRYESMS